MHVKIHYFLKIAIFFSFFSGVPPRCRPLQRTAGGGVYLYAPTQRAVGLSIASRSMLRLYIPIPHAGRGKPRL